MNNDFGEEAKRAISDGARRKARDRLMRDGCDSRDAIHRRVRALAAERNLQPADYRKLMYKRLGMSAVFDFCDKHKVSVDWLLFGDLEGLRRMARRDLAPRPPWDDGPPPAAA